ncbi:NOD26-like intrinsic protein 7 [Perilla frutescens var. hirtella]|uniref:NOD26-like intrinsic protein 7 n=1 Tax=Perilla frutescens var. hirtella TaxID=608512 RepID=A0AAD4P0H6_PERFH|nr:NOD26-like intrinsic protein 7 [Perilla frutescens var. hirtella]
MPSLGATLSSNDVSSTSSQLPSHDHGSSVYLPVHNMPSAMNFRLARMVVAEAVGTFVLMFCISGIIGNLHFMGIRTGLMEYAATAGLTVVVIVFSIGTISGAHINPAVTIAFAAAGPFPWSKVPLYVLAQVGGSVLATYAGWFVYDIKPELMLTAPIHHGWKSAFLVELVATFIVLFLTTSLFNEQQSLKQVSGFVAGGAICLGVLISGPVSGGSMNPARSLGPALVTWTFDSLWIYLVAPTLGAIAGVVVFRVLRLQGWPCDSGPSQSTIQPSHRSLH